MTEALLTFAGAGTFFLALGLVLSWVLGRRPARAHGALAAALAACLLAPAVWIGFGRLGWGVLPAPGAGEVASYAVPASAAHGARASAVEPLVALKQTSAPAAHAVQGELLSPPKPSPAARRSSPPAATPALSLRPELLWLAWGAMSLLLLGWIAAAVAGGRWLVRAAAPVESGPLREALDRAAGRMGICSVQLRESRMVACPVVWCWGRVPVVVVPSPAEQCGAADVDWDGVFRHELAHVARRDHLVSALAALVRAAMPWNPLAHVAARRLRTLSERACDDWAVAQADADPARYAHTLVSLQAQRLGFGGLAAASTRSGLAGRVQRLLSHRRGDPRAGRVWAAGIALGACAALALVGLAREASPRTGAEAAASAASAGSPAMQEGRRPESAQEREDDPRTWTDETWRRKLTTPGEDARWFVGANLGMALSKLPGDRAWEIAEGNWQDMAAAVKKQFLKGLCPAMKKTDGINDRFFDIQDLGMRDPDPGVRDFARAYIGQLTFTDLKGDPGQYEALRPRLRDVPAADAIIAETRRFFDRARAAADAKAINEALSRLRDAANDMRELSAMQEAAKEEGVYALIAAWVASGAVQEDDGRIKHLYANIGRPPNPEGLGGILAEATQLFEKGQVREAVEAVEDLVRHHPEEEAMKAIPLMIGMIDADNSYDTVYGVGYFGLGRITGVSYSPFHDGAWWRRWWEKNKSDFAAEIAATPIPDLPETASGKDYTPYPADLDTLDGKMRFIRERMAAGDVRAVQNAAEQIEEEHTREEAARAIPLLIGVIDADNSYDTIYGVGYFALGRLTGVDYSPYHDGAWWRRWWEEHKGDYPAEIGAMPIPDLPRTSHGQRHEPFPATLDTLQGKMDWVVTCLTTGRDFDLSQIAREMAEHEDPRCIPLMIGLIEADNTYDTIYGVGYFGLSKLTDVKYDESHGGAWWRDWWNGNRQRYSADVAAIEIPDLREPFASWKEQQEVRQKARAEAELEREFEGQYAERFTAPDHERMQYYLIKNGPLDDAAPEGGHPLVIILPGGDGSADFHPFCRRIVKHALPEGFAGVQLIAPAWIEDKDRRVWPTRNKRPTEAEFSTEEFIAAAVRDVQKRITVNPDRIYALGWSSSGPALYVDALTPPPEGESESPVDGWFIAMSVFWPHEVPALQQAAKGKAFYLLHSPEDFIKIDQHARAAETALKNAGALVRLATYSGGHGWREDPYGHIRRGVDWLDEQGG